MSSSYGYGQAFDQVPLDSLRSLGTPLDSALRWPATSEARRAESSGAEEGIRTPTILLSPAPQAGASASSATSALEGKRDFTAKKAGAYAVQPLPQTPSSIAEAAARPQKTAADLRLLLRGDKCASNIDPFAVPRTTTNNWVVSRHT